MKGSLHIHNEKPNAACVGCGWRLDGEEDEEGEELWEVAKDACMYGAQIHIATQVFEHARTP